MISKKNNQNNIENMPQTYTTHNKGEKIKKFKPKVIVFLNS